MFIYLQNKHVKIWTNLKLTKILHQENIAKTS